VKPIDQARADLNAVKAGGDHDDMWKAFELVLQTGIKLKAVMVEKKLTLAKTKCPKCNGAESLHGRLIVGQASGRHRRSGGAFRMWCDTCADIRMME
jgi:hypothetical protein